MTALKPAPRGPRPAREPRLLASAGVGVVAAATSSQQRGEGPVQERISEPGRIRDLLEALARERAAAWLRLPSEERLHVRALALGEDALRMVPAPGSPESLRRLRAGSRVTLEWSGHSSLFRAASDCHPDDERALRVALPASVERVQQRSYRRVTPPEPVAVRCRPAGPDGGAERVLVLRDLSCEGLSLWLGAAPVEASLGQQWLLSLMTPAGLPVVLHGEVRCLGAPVGDRLGFLGMRIRPVSHQDGLAWLELLEARLHPRIRMATDHLDGVWDLYEAAGYFALSGKRPADFFDIKASFLSATGRALQAADVAIQAVWPEAGPPVATLSAVRLYETAWLGFHMAKCSGPAPDGTPGRLVLRDIHLSIYERIQRDPGARWIIGHTQVRPVWSRLCHHDLTARFVARGDAAVWRFRAFEIRRPPPPIHGAIATPRSVQVGPAAPHEVHEVLQGLARSVPEPMVDALDLVPRRFDIQGVRRRWWGAGLQRDRGMLVAREHGAVVAALIMELSDEGLHVFRLLDHALPVALAPGGEAHFPALLDAAHGWYFARGREAWACFVDARNRVPVTPHMTDLGEADMCILSTERLPEFFEHLHQITAPAAH